MDKTDLVKIVVVLVVVGFITEQFYFGFISTGFKSPFSASSSTGEQNQTGDAMFLGTIRTYDPVIGIPVNTSASVVDRILKMDGVKETRTSGNFLLILTETRDDVPTIARALRDLGVSVISVANIALPPTIEVVTDNGTINASTSYLSVVRVETDPVLDVDSEIPVMMSATVLGTQLIGYDLAYVPVSHRVVTVNATVNSILRATSVYSVPWENRTIDLASFGITTDSAYAVDFKKVNTIVFSPPLGLNDTLVKKALPYITFIDQSSAEVLPSFVDLNQLRADFPGINVTARPSIIKISSSSSSANSSTTTGNSSTIPTQPMALPSLPFEHTDSYTYSLTLAAGQDDVGGIGEPGRNIVATLPLLASVGDIVPVNVSVTAVGNKVLSIAVAG